MWIEWRRKHVNERRIQDTPEQIGGKLSSL
jgi:hypothetical protein